MSGRLLTIASKQTYTWNVTASTSTGFYLGPRVIPTPECVSGMLLIRVVAFTLPTGNIKIGLANTMLMPDDPGSLYFVATSDPLATVAEVAIASGDSITAPGRLYPKGWSSGCGAMVSAYMSVNPGATGGAGSITFAMEAVFRDA